MLYVTRYRPKDTVGPEQLAEINRLIDSEVIPGIQEIQGVRSAQVYNSIAGELTTIIDIENMATIDRIIASRGLAPALGKLTGYMIRTGGEVLYDRPAWQGLYGVR